MNLIEAVKKSNGKPVRRRSWGDRFPLANVHFEIVLCADEILADDWYVVEPKSKIEEAIERAFPSGETSVNTPYASIALRRVVNLALDEAANVVGCPSSSGLEGRYYSAITTLKVKE